VLVGAALYFTQVVVPATPPLFIPTPTHTRSPESFTSEAEAFFKEGKLTQAIDAYKQAIQADPKNPSNYVALARAQVFAGNYTEAKITAEDALILNPNNSMSHAVKAWALDKLEDYLEAEASVKQALDLDPNNALAHAYLAEILIDKGDFGDIQTAIDESHKAQTLAPNLLETHRVRGYVLYATQNYAGAIQEYKSAIAINDKLWDLHYSLGWTYRFDQQYDLAVKEMLEAIALNPTNPDIPTDVSRTYATLGQFPKAVQSAEQALKINPSDPRLHGNLGVMLYKNKEYEKAAIELALAVRGGTTADGVVVKGLPLAPGRVADEYYSIYGLSLTHLDRCTEAVPIFQLILQNIAEDQIAYYNAKEGINYCQQNLGTQSPKTTGTPTPKNTGKLTPTP
jgi:tetratricopeptide (TPR) repeat protein